jgi:trehalose 6-phosphate synthase/phosphatase
MIETKAENIINHTDQLLKAYHLASNRIFFIDYDGTLAPFQPLPELALPSKEVKDSLLKLASDKLNTVVVISGRDQDSLEKWLGDLPITLVAEHGAFFKTNDSQWQTFFNFSTAWIQKMLPPLDALMFSYEGSFIEHKHYSLTWHYRKIANKISGDEIAEIIGALEEQAKLGEFTVYSEDCAIELRTNGINKGKIAYRYMQDKFYDFKFAIGDGKTDEDIFKTIGKNHYTIKVGNYQNSDARFFLERQDYTLTLLNLLTFKLT